MLAHEWQSGQSWQVGVGRPGPLDVAVPWRGDRYVCKGAIYSYAELTRPVGERLTDVQWREMTGPKRTDGAGAWIADSPLVVPRETGLGVTRGPAFALPTAPAAIQDRHRGLPDPESTTLQKRPQGFPQVGPSLDPRESAGGVRAAWTFRRL